MLAREWIRSALHHWRIATVVVAGLLLVSCKGDREKESTRLALVARTGPATSAGDSTTRYADDGQWVQIGRAHV